MSGRRDTLAALARLAVIERDESRTRVASAYDQLTETLRRESELESRLEAVRAQMQQSLRPGETMDPLQRQYAVAYLMQEHHSLRAIKRDVMRARTAEERVRRELAVRQSCVMALEKAIEAVHRVAVTDTRRRDEKELDRYAAGIGATLRDSQTVLSASRPLNQGER